MDSVKSQSVPAMVWSFKHVYNKEEKVEGPISATFHILSKDRDLPLFYLGQGLFSYPTIVVITTLLSASSLISSINE